MSKYRSNGPGSDAVGTAIAKELAAGELAFGRFLELVPDAIVVVDAEGRIVSLNAQSERLFGYPRSELLGEHIEILVPTRFGNIHQRHRDRYFTDPRTRPMGIGLELSGRRKDGSEFPADISLSAIETVDGNFAAAAVRDLTERAEAERERKELEAEAREARSHQARRLESIGELAGGIAHDFNNLLAVILNNAELALHKSDGDAPFTQELKEIEGAAERGARLTRQLLIFSRRQVTASEPVDVNSVVTEMEHLLRRSIGEHIQLEVELADQVPSVMADPSQIEQVILNLVINARDAMPSGGRLGIETRVVELDADYGRTRPDVTPGHYLRLTVADNGVGMAHGVVSRAFEPFFTTKPTGEGTGLGLATVYGIVKQCDGHVSIYSEEGNGTVVRVHLPIAADAARAERGPSPASVRPGTGQSILVVEDAAPVRRTICEILRVNGYRVAEAGSADAALELLDGGGIDLVLTDVVMPGMLGTELADRVHGAHPAVPLLFMSGYSEVAGPIDDSSKLIEKPFTSATLLTKVQDTLAAYNGG